MKSIESNCLKTVSAERVYTELIVSTNKGDAAKFITRLSELGILRQIHKSLYFDELKAEQAKELSKLLEWFVKEYPQDKIEKWYPFHLILFSGLPKDMQTSIAKQLTYPSNFIKSINKIKLFLDKIGSGELKDSTDGELALKLSGLRIEDVLYLLAVTKDDALKSRLRHYLTHSRSVSLSINGHDLLMMGVTLGALIGSILQTLKIQKIDGKISNREDELELAKKMVDDDSDSATNLE
jgi:tRNA nucleotidyltransferase (CCA-adding enzyme)